MVCFIMAREIIDRKNMVDLGPNRHFFPAIIIIPSKVCSYFFKLIGGLASAPSRPPETNMVC